MTPRFLHGCLTASREGSGTAGYYRQNDRGDVRRTAPALNLIITAIVYWNTCYMDKAANFLRRQGRLPDPNLLKHVSPLGLYPISLTGDYNWHSGAADRMNSRPLNLYAARIPA